MLAARPVSAPIPAHFPHATRPPSPLELAAPLRADPTPAEDVASRIAAFVASDEAKAAAEIINGKPAAPAPAPEPAPPPPPERPVLRVVEPPPVEPVAVAPAEPPTPRPRRVTTTEEPESLVEPAPRRRGGMVFAVVGLLAAAGIAALVLTSPSFTAPKGDPVAARNQPAKTPPAKIADNTLPDPPTDPRAVVPPPVEPTTAPPADPPPGEPPPADTAAATTAAAVPDPPPVDPKSTPDEPTKKTKPGKKPRRREPEEEEREKDVFDQLREHMEAKKAAEAAAKAAASQPTPTPTPTPTPPPVKTEPTDPAEKAKETLDRARQAASSGNYALAYTLAKQSYNLSKTQDALELMGVAACRNKNADQARSAVGGLSGARRTAVVSACSQSGITL